MSLAEIKTAIEKLSFEQRAELAAWLHGWEDDGWDEQMKRDVADGKLDNVLREVEDDIKAGGSAICREVQNASAILAGVPSVTGPRPMLCSR